MSIISVWLIVVYLTEETVTEAALRVKHTYIQTFIL